MTGVSSSTDPKRIVLSVLICLGALLFIVLPSFMFLLELREAQSQHRVNQTYVPVDATVISSTVTSYRPSRSGVHYIPKITYEYEVNGTKYQSSELKAVYVWGDQDWADSIVARYRPRTKCQAFYDPARPEQAILLRGYSFRPYFQMLEMTFCLTGGICMSAAGWFGRKRDPVPADSGWFELFPQFSQRQHLKTAALSTALWYGLGAVTAVHYFYYVPAPRAERSLDLLWGFAILGLIGVAFTVRYFLMTRSLGEPRLLLNRMAAVPGQEFKFTISQRASQQLLLTSVRARLRCIATKVHGKSQTKTVLHEEHPVTLKDHTLHAGETLDLSGAITIPPDQPPTGRDASGKNTWINWEIGLDCRVKGSPHYETRFPLRVNLPPAKVPAPPADLPPRARVDVRQIDSSPSQRVLSKWHVFVLYMIGLLALPILVLALGTVAVAYPVLFKDRNFPSPLPSLTLSPEQALALFILGAVVALVAILYGLLLPNYLGNAYLRSVAVRKIRARPDALVNPRDADARFVEIIPRANWNRMMLENTTDIGFLAVDAQRREIRFEGDCQRCRIPADAIFSCTLEKSLVSQTAQPKAPGNWLVVVRAYSETGVWEAPFTVRFPKGRALMYSPPRPTKELHAQITALLPASVEKAIQTVSKGNS